MQEILVGGGIKRASGNTRTSHRQPQLGDRTGFSLHQEAHDAARFLLEINTQLGL